MKTKIYSIIDNKLIGESNQYDSKQDILKTFELAADAFNKFKDVSLDVIKARIHQFIVLIQQNKDHLAELILHQVAKTKQEALNEINRTIEFIEFCIKEHDYVIKHQKDFVYQPLGVVTIICSFNYPFNLVVTKIIMALLTNNTVVFKASLNTCLIADEIVRLFQLSGFDSNIVNAINVNDIELYKYLYKNKYIKYLFFTGSSRVAKKIIKQLNPRIKYNIEGSAKNIAIIWKDADMQSTIKNIIKGVFSFNGQRCTALKLIVVHTDVYYQLIDLLKQEIKQLKVGSAIDDNNQITELISLKAVQYNIDLMKDAISKNAKNIFDIKSKDNILYPNLIIDINNKCKLFKQEQFAPICCLTKVNNELELLKVLKSSEFGLQGSVFTKNKQLINNLINQWEVGRININSACARSPDNLPFIGYKDSGFGFQGDTKDILISLLNKKVIYK